MKAWLALCALGLASAMSTSGQAGERPRPLCAAANGHDQDPSLSQAVSAVFPRMQQRSAAKDCAFPLKLLHYGDADVLLTTKGSPEDSDVSCHGCGGILSAFVLRRTPTGLKPVARFIDFAEEGSSGNAGEISAVQLAGHDAFGVEAGGTFQGYTSVGLTFFLFRDGRLEEMKPDLPLSASNGGAVDDDAKAISIDGAWRIDPARPDAVTVDYVTTVGTAKRRSSATWVAKEKALVLSAGQPPKDYDAVAGR